MKRVAIYARYSTDLQHERSIDDQLRVCGDRAKREGWSVYDRYTDYAISGANMDRAGLQRMLRDARAGKFNIILSEALDRLSRDQADIATIFKRMQFAGIDIVTLSEDRVSIVDIGLRGTMNQLYRVETANKVKRGQQGRIRAGKTAGGIPYGYDLVRKLDGKGEIIRGDRTINEDQAQVVRRIYREYASGMSPRAIVHRLNKDGVRGPGGMEWTLSTISGNPRHRAGILNNEVYIGRLLWNRRTHIEDPETGKRLIRTNPESEWTTGEAPDLRIIEQELWDKVRHRQRQRSCPQAVAAFKTMRDVSRVRPKSLLSGLVRCGWCGGGFTTRRNQQFSCATRDNRGTCRNQLHVGRRALEDKVLGSLKEQLGSDLERCAAFCETYARLLRDFRQERNELIRAALDELARIESEYDRMTDSPERGGRATSDAHLQSLTARHKLVTRQLRRARETAEPLESHYREHISGLVEALSRNSGHYDSYDAFRSAIGQVVLTPNDDNTTLLVDFRMGTPRPRGGRPRLPRTGELGRSSGGI